MNRKRTKRRYQQHGLYRAVTALRPHGLAGVDQRSAAARVANGFKAELEAALGGDVTPQQQTLVELAALELLVVRHCDAFLLEQETLLVGRGKQKRLLPVLKDRATHAHFLAELMDRLGLDRREARPVDLVDYLEENYGGGNGEGKNE